MSDSRTTVYFDYAATTPVDERVAEAMCECLTVDGCFANPASSSHEPGRQARGRVEQARRQVAALIGARPTEIVWTSGATESDNTALKGVVHFHREEGGHLVTSRTEHKAVLDTCRQLEREGFEVTYLVPSCDGIITPEQVAAALRDDTVLVSIMHVNNEIGVVQDIAAIGALCRERDVLFHVDAAQSAGKVPVDVEAMHVDLMSLSAHKLYGPKGVGALYVRGGRRTGMEPLMHGGGHEWGMRSGTLATHQIVGMGQACCIAAAEMTGEGERLKVLRNRLWDGIRGLGGVMINGDEERRAPGILNVCFEGVEGESLLFALRDLAVSSGSACTSATREASYVLRALGRSDQLAQSSLRISLGRYTTPEDVDFGVRTIVEQVNRLRALAPPSASEKDSKQAS